MEKNSNKILLTVLGIAVLVVATIGATFAYFSATASTDATTVETGILAVDASATKIEETAIKPTTFSQATAAGNADVAHAKLTVDTTGTTVTGGYYDVYLTANITDFEASSPASGARSDVMYALYDGTTVVASGDLGTDLTSTKINTSSITIDPNAQTKTKEYDLFIYINETNQEQNDLQGITVSAQLSVQASTKTQ